MRLALLAVLLLAACADDIATRDYTVTTCPPPPTQGQSIEVCDRGVGQSPRFVTIEACAAELGLTIPAHSWGIASMSPARERCVAEGASALNTIDDVRRALTR